MNRIERTTRGTEDPEQSSRPSFFILFILSKAVYFTSPVTEGTG